MIKRLLATLLTTSFLFAGAAQAEAYAVDGAHAFAVFKIMHLGIAPTYGQFVKVDGQMTWAEGAAPSFTIEIDANSIFTGNKKRDDHLKSPDFFNVKQHGKLTFTSKSAKKTGDNTYEVTGEIGIKGVTQPFTTTVTKTGAGVDPWGNTRVGFTANFKLDRRAFGINFMPDGLGNDVDVMLSIEGIAKKP